MLGSSDFLIIFIVSIYGKNRDITSRCAVTLIYSIFFHVKRGVRVDLMHYVTLWSGIENHVEMKRCTVIYTQTRTH